MMSTRSALIAGCLCLTLAAADAAAQVPDQIEGLVAWYRADTLGRTLQNGEPVRTWDDASGNGHHLTDDENGEPALFQVAQVNKHPAVQVRAANTHSVTAPFDLADHTVFLVFKSTANDRALFAGETADTSGVVLRVGGQSHEYHDRGNRAEQVKGYNAPAALAEDYTVTVLGRDGGKLRAFLDGEDRSAGTDFAGPIRVGRFFHIKHSRFASADGNGLWIAEMLFYSRWLDDAERARVTRYLADKYALTVGGAAATVAPGGVEIGSTGAPGVRRGVAVLSSKGGLNVNDAGVFVPWDLQDEIGPPFTHRLEGEKTRLTCTRGGTLVRLYVSLPLSADFADANIRVMFLLNGAKYLRGEGRSGPLGKAGDGYRGTVRAEVITRLEAGDFVEVVTFREGAAGEVMLDPETAVFVAEER